MRRTMLSTLVLCSLAGVATAGPQEEAVTAKRLAKFARFEGFVGMDEVGNHPAGHNRTR